MQSFYPQVGNYRASGIQRRIAPVDLGLPIIFLANSSTARGYQQEGAHRMRYFGNPNLSATQTEPGANAGINASTNANCNSTASGQARASSPPALPDDPPPAYAPPSTAAAHQARLRARIAAMHGRRQQDAGLLQPWPAARLVHLLQDPLDAVAPRQLPTAPVAAAAAPVAAAAAATATAAPAPAPAPAPVAAGRPQLFAGRDIDPAFYDSDDSDNLGGPFSGSGNLGNMGNLDGAGNVRTGNNANNDVDHGLPAAYGAADAPFSPIVLRVSTAVRVCSDQNVVCIELSPPQQASQVAEAVLAAVKAGSAANCGVPMIDEEGRPRPIRIEVDAGIVVEGTGNVVGREEFVERVVRERLAAAAAARSLTRTPQPADAGHPLPQDRPGGGLVVESDRTDVAKPAAKERERPEPAEPATRRRQRDPEDEEAPTPKRSRGLPGSQGNDGVEA